MKIGIVVSDFNKEITSTMLETAKKESKTNNLEIIKELHVPGAFEIPFAAKKLFEDKEIDAVVVLGAVIQGKTDHNLIIVNTIAPILTELSIKNNKPLGFGVIGPRVSRKEAEERAEEYAERAVKTVLKMFKLN